MLRTRRPLLVLMVIIALLIIGYVVKEVGGSGGSSPINTPASTGPGPASSVVPQHSTLR